MWEWKRGRFRHVLLLVRACFVVRFYFLVLWVLRSATYRMKRWRDDIFLFPLTSGRGNGLYNVGWSIDRVPGWIHETTTVLE